MTESLNVNGVIRKIEGPLFSQRSVCETEPSTNEKEFSVVTYNTLADVAVVGSPRYEYCEDQFRQRSEGSHRHELLLQELKWLDGDILCLQEVDKIYFDNLLHQNLSKLGFEGYFALRLREHHGVATFFKNEVFELVAKKEISISEEMQEACKESGQEALRDHLKIPTKVLMLALRHKTSNQFLIIGNVHISFDWFGFTIRQLLEISLASKILHDFKETFKAMHKTQVIPHILCGDFNVESHFPAYKVLASGGLDDDDYKTLESTDYIKYYESVFVPTPKTNKMGEKFLQYPIVFIICPLNSIMKEQVKKLNNNRISAAFVGSSEEVDRSLNLISSTTQFRWMPAVGNQRFLDMFKYKISEKEKEVLSHMKKYFVSPLKTAKSTYKTVLGREPGPTNHEGGNDYWTLDYLWHSSDSLLPIAALDVVPLSLLNSLIGLPNQYFPSDHLSLKAVYRFLP